MRTFPALLCCVLLAASADARAEGRTVAVGWEARVFDPWAWEQGLRGTLELPLAHRLHLGLAGALPLASPHDPPLTTTLVEPDNHIIPTVTTQRWRGTLGLHWSPFTVTTQRLEGHLALRTGLGLVGTQDDLEALHQEGEPYAEATEHQIHPTANLGLFLDLGGPRLRGRVGLERVRWIETVSSTSLELHRPLMLSLALVLRSPFPPPDPDELTDQTYEGDGPAR
jgi:hypothetical protein